MSNVRKQHETHLLGVGPVLGVLERHLEREGEALEALADRVARDAQVCGAWLVNPVALAVLEVGGRPLVRSREVVLRSSGAESVRTTAVSDQQQIV